MSKIVDLNGNPIDMGAIKEPQTASVAQLENTYLTPMLDGLTPARLAAHLRAADQGDLSSQARLFADMEERDAHMFSEMGKRKAAVMGLDWDIVPPRNATAAEKATAEWVKEMLTDAVDPMEDLILALMDGVGQGYAPVEMEWRQEGKEWLPAFYPRPQEWFRLDSKRRELRLQDSSADGAVLRPFGWVMHTHGKAKTGYLGRMGLYRVLVWPFLYKAYSLGDFAEFLETYGLPIIVGKYMSGAPAEEKASLMRAVMALAHDARAIMPADMALEIQKIAGGGDGTPHMTMVDWADRSQSKGILGQTLSAEAKPTGLGSNLGQIHNEVRKDIRNADARQVAGTITRDLIYAMVAINRGGLDSLNRCPRLVFDTGEAEDLAQLADGVGKLVTAGMRTIPVSWIHEKGRIPLPVEGEATLGADLTPPTDKPAGDQAAALAALAAQAGQEAPQVPDQAAIDAALDAIPTENIQALSEALLKPIFDLLQEAGGYDKALAALSAAYPDMDGGRLEDMLARLMFAGALWGQDQAVQ